MQTSLGEFTVDEEHIYQGELKRWIEVASEFDVEERREMAETSQGRRQLGASDHADGMFIQIEDDAESFECEPLWMNETSAVKPHSPKVPFMYMAYSIVSCWSEDEKADNLNHQNIGEDRSESANESSQIGTARRCVSTYGPNAGKFKPGVSADGSSMVYMQYKLVTKDGSYTLDRLPNHPLQLMVELEDTRGKNTTTISYQLDDAQPDLRQFCSPRETEPSDNFMFEDSALSFLGLRGDLRHWAVSEQGEPDENGTITTGRIVAEYFDHNSEGHMPHSIHMNRKEPDFVETRFHEFKEDLTEQEVADWLGEHFAQAHLYDMKNFTGCVSLQLTASRVSTQCPATVYYLSIAANGMSIILSLQVFKRRYGQRCSCRA